VVAAVLADGEVAHEPVVDVVAEARVCPGRQVGAGASPGDATDSPTRPLKSVICEGSLIGPGPRTGPVGSGG
jgi:hypothetical protein